MNYKGAETYILNRLEKELPVDLFYHNIHHTCDVLKASEYYGQIEKIENSDMLLLKTAALYHDCGFLNKYQDNENDSVAIVEAVLPGFGYNSVQIDSIKQMILCTEMPQKPETILEKILCDADLDYLGRTDFYMIGIRLLQEWNAHNIPTTLKEWYSIELRFLQQHKYFTQAANQLRNEMKLLHLKQIKELLGGNNQ